ncbi:MAG: hypothetical protein ABIE74_03725 [Pseudomonadota bacterium]
MSIVRLRHLLSLSQPQVKELPPPPGITPSIRVMTNEEIKTSQYRLFPNGNPHSPISKLFGPDGKTHSDESEPIILREVPIKIDPVKMSNALIRWAGTYVLPNRILSEILLRHELYMPAYKLKRVVEALAQIDLIGLIDQLIKSISQQASQR